MEVWHEHIEGFQHDSKRLPLNHPSRIQRHDAKMWRREESKAREAGAIRMRCSCSHCGGSRSIKIANIEKHLIKYGRHPLWRTSLDGDSSDDEWAAAFQYHQNQFPDDKRLLDSHGGKDPPKMEPATKPQFTFPEESIPADATTAEANPSETNPAEINPVETNPANVLPWNPAQRFLPPWNPAPWNPAAAPWNPAPPTPPPWNAAPWHPQGQQWGPGFPYPQQWGPLGWPPAQYFRGVEPPYPVGPTWPAGATFGQGEGMEKGPQPACTETSSARPVLDTGKQATNRAGNRSWKDQAAKYQEQGMKRHKRDRRTSSPIVQEYHVEGSTPQGFGNEITQNPTYVFSRIETKLSHMEMVIDGVEAAMEGMTEKMDKMIQIVENLQKSLPSVVQRDAVATSNVQDIPQITKESEEPPLPKVEGPVIEVDQRQLDLGVTYLSKFASAMVRDPVHTGSDADGPHGSHGVLHAGQNIAHNIALPGDWKQNKRHRITQPEPVVDIDRRILRSALL